MTSLAVRHLRGNRRQSVFALTAAGLATAMLVGVSGIAYSFYCAFMEFAEATGHLDSQSMDKIAAVLYAVVPFLSAIIIVGAVVVISNAFSISAGEQLRQFGILKSVGGTDAQIRREVCTEGALLGVLSIPIGVAVGYAATLVGMVILNHYLGDALQVAATQAGDERVPLVFHAVLSLPATAGAVAMAFATIMFSAWRVARKVSRTAAIDAIRQQGEVVVKPGKLRTSKLIGNLFGFEGTLAAKALKRAKRKYRATVVSLVTSIVLVLVSASFGTMLYKTAQVIKPEMPGNVQVAVMGQEGQDEVDYDKIEQRLLAYGTMTLTFEKMDNAAFYTCQVADAEDFCRYVNAELPPLLGEKLFVNAANLESMQREINSIYTMLMLFIYCFVAMLAAVGITGVLATINSNISLRTGEFAVLQAVGMDSRGLRRMLNLESLLYGLKSLLIGIPFGLGLSYVLLRLFRRNVVFAFNVPWPTIGICILGVFAVTFISMAYASGKLRRGNIAEAMRAI
jgi:ABC-type lipoprotein release transport system permease subunit